MSDKPREIIVKNHHIIVDADDFSFLSRFTWHVRKDKKTHYCSTNVKIGGKYHGISMHRLICGLSASQIDHKNRNGLDNRKENLRFCTNTQNSYNRIRYNKSGFRGVYKTKPGKNYSCQIQCMGKKITKHGFKTPEDAARAYDKLNKELHGEFGIRNFKD